MENMRPAQPAERVVEPGVQTIVEPTSEAAVESTIETSESALESIDHNSELTGSGETSKEHALEQTRTKERMDEVREALAELDLESSANYEGDWTLALRDRLMHPETKRRFIECKRTYPALEDTYTGAPEESAEAATAINVRKKVDLTHEEVEEAIRDYDAVVEEVFSSTRIGTAESDGQKPHVLGRSPHYRDPGIVYDDAINSDTRQPIDDRQKNIVEMHEKAHSVFARLTRAEKNRVDPFIRFGRRMDGYKLRLQADEFVARMSQLKSYYGMKGAERFTRAHLDAARDRYVADVGLDNNMTEFFTAIAGNEDAAVDLFNEFPC